MEQVHQKGGRFFGGENLPTNTLQLISFSWKGRCLLRCSLAIRIFLWGHFFVSDDMNITQHMFWRFFFNKKRHGIVFVLFLLMKWTLVDVFGVNVFVVTVVRSLGLAGEEITSFCWWRDVGKGQGTSDSSLGRFFAGLWSSWCFHNSHPGCRSLGDVIINSYIQDSYFVSFYI